MTLHRMVEERLHGACAVVDVGRTALGKCCRHEVFDVACADCIQRLVSERGDQAPRRDRAIDRERLLRPPGTNLLEVGVDEGLERHDRRFGRQGGRRLAADLVPEYLPEAEGLFAGCCSHGPFAAELSS